MLFSAALVFSIIALWLILSRSEGTISENEKAFAVDDTANITKLFLADKNYNQVLLEKIRPGYWIVNKKYKARNDLIDVLLQTIKNINIIAPVAIAAQDQVIKDIASRGVKIEIYKKKYLINLFDKIKLIPYESLEKVYYVGGPTQDHSGTYMILEGKNTPFITYLQGFTGFLSPRYSPREKDWRDRTIFKFKVNQIDEITVKYPDSLEKSFSLKFLGNRNFIIKNLVTGEILSNPDTLKVLDYFTNYFFVAFEDFPINITDKQIDSIRKEKPYFIITVKDTAGIVRKITAWKKLNAGGYNIFDKDTIPDKWDVDRLYASINNDSDFVLIQYFTFDNLTKTYPYFKARTK